MKKIYLYSGAGNTFAVLDGRDALSLEEAEIRGLCGQYSTDGLMILRKDARLDFGMEYFNPDGSGGMMCGNGGRCIAAFASLLEIKPTDGKIYHFEAPDGEHTAEILSSDVPGKPEIRKYARQIIRLKMRDVTIFYPILDGEFVDTGTRHFVKFVPDVETVDVEAEGRRYRYDPSFAPKGANANFVQVSGPGALMVRTFEKGVERETLACGTGITASAIAAYIEGIAPAKGNPASYEVQARQDKLKVDFIPTEGYFREVYLTGPAVLTDTVTLP